MRLNFSTSWIFRGWITCALVTFYAQDVISKPGSRSPRDHQRIRNTDVEWTDVISKPVKCDDNHYIKDSRCCKKCGPGLHVLTHCTDFHQTKCIKCNRGEYQPGWTEEDRCLRQKFCDQIKGFMESPENHFAEEPCRCPPHRQCHPINCEFCERIPTCSAGYGLEVDPEFTNGRKICVACKKGFFSADNIGEQCRPWTSCKAEGRTETHPGSAHADAVCGPHVSASSWVIVSVLSVITVLCLLILLLFCYKDKLKLLSVNLRSCVQNLKRTRIQQETLAPLYHSGGPKCAPCETTKLICQAPHNPTDDTPCTFLTPVPEVKVTLPFTADLTEKEATVRETVTEDQSEGSGEPEEVSEEEEEEVVSVSPLFVGSCVCVISIREPLEVGENEDCSQAVSPGTLANCSCRGLDGDGEKSESDGGKKCDGTQQKVDLSKSETVAASFVSLSPPLVHTSSTSSPHPELCLPLSQALAPQEFKPHETDRSRVKQEELYILTSTNSTETSSTSVMSSVSPLMTSSSVGDLYLDKPCDDSGPGQGQGLCWEDGSGNKLSSGDSELDCSPESLHSQLDEPTLTSGQVLGNNNTTFISSGQVMNFSGDVIVVYVSQTSVGSDGTGPDDAFGSPVQEEASEAAPVFRGNSRARGDSTSHTTVQDETLPVHEMVEGRLMGK